MCQLILKTGIWKIDNPPKKTKRMKLAGLENLVFKFAR